jgi:predicted HNH restriction endonuclease
MIAGLGTKCVKCGISGPKGFLDVHHKDGNYRNNDPRNLELLCPNDHRMADLACQSVARGVNTYSNGVTEAS